MTGTDTVVPAEECGVTLGSAQRHPPRLAHCRAPTKPGFREKEEGEWLHCRLIIAETTGQGPGDGGERLAWEVCLFACALGFSDISFPTSTSFLILRQCHTHRRVGSVVQRAAYFLRRLRISSRPNVRAPSKVCIAYTRAILLPGHSHQTRKLNRLPCCLLVRGPRSSRTAVPTASLTAERLIGNHTLHLIRRLS